MALWPKITPLAAVLFATSLHLYTFLLKLFSKICHFDATIRPKGGRPGEKNLDTTTCHKWQIFTFMRCSINSSMNFLKSLNSIKQLPFFENKILLVVYKWAGCHQKRKSKGHPLEPGHRLYVGSIPSTHTYCIMPSVLIVEEIWNKHAPTPAVLSIFLSVANRKGDLYAQGSKGTPNGPK